MIARRSFGLRARSGGTSTFSDGSNVSVPALINNGAGVEVTFSSRIVTSLRFTASPMSRASGNAGAPQAVDPGTAVELNGVGSVDPDEGEIDYRWRQIGGIAVTLANHKTATPSIVAPSNLSRHEALSFELIVNDGEFDSFPSVANVTVAGDVATVNLAPPATVSAAAENVPNQLAVKAVDGVRVGYPIAPTREWAALGQRAGAWINLQWPAPIIVDQIVLYDRPNSNDRVLGGTLEFSDGSVVSVGPLNNDGSASPISIPPKTMTSVKFTITAVSTSTANVGLSEFEVFGVTATP